MIDARICTALPSHPKTKKLIRKMGDGAGWRLVCLFLWVASNRPNGDLSGLDADDIEIAVDWPGEEGVFVRALCDVGFLDGEPGSFCVHDWAEHNPWAAGHESRAEKARWMAACKHHGRDGAAEAYPELAAKFADSRKQDADSLLDPATSMLQAENSMLRSATSMLATGNSCAPSPSPSPSTKEYPPSFADAQEATPAKAKAKGKTFSAWIAEIRASGEKAISEYASVWEYAETVCLPTEWVELAWLCFRRRYQTDEKAKRKRYTDWRRVFLRAVKENWMGLWVWSDRDQSYRLTTVGTQADREMREVA